jgi:predicted secreted Zn-dependent protease
MMNKKAAITFYFSLAAVLAIAQIPGNQKDLLEWNEFYKLGWEDFQGKPGEGSAGDAGTAVRIKASPYRVNKKIKYDVYAYFNRAKSWSNERSDALLSHEQIHFDIAEVYARKIRKKISELEKRNVNDIKVYNAEITKLLEESNEVDQLYDIETLHGVLTRKQEIWKKNIEEELKSLERYKKTKQIIRAGP